MRLAEKCAGRRDGGPDGFQSAGDGGLCQGLRGAFTTEDAEDTEENRTKKRNKGLRSIPPHTSFHSSTTATRKGSTYHYRPLMDPLPLLCVLCVLCGKTPQLFQATTSEVTTILAMASGNRTFQLKAINWS